MALGWLKKADMVCQLTYNEIPTIIDKGLQNMHVFALLY